MDGQGFPERSAIASAIMRGDITTFAKYFFACLEELATKKYEPQELMVSFLQQSNTFWLNVENRMKAYKAAGWLPKVNNIETQSLGSFTANIKKLMDNIPHNGKSKLCVVFAFDEVRALLKPAIQGQAENDLPFTCMRNVASMFPPNCGLAIVVLDTVSRVSNLIPTSSALTSRDPSLRPQLMGQSTKLFPPIYTLPTVDINVKKIREGVDKLSQLIRPPTLYRYGRPLWSASCNVQDYTNVFHYAMKRLVGGKDYNPERKLEDCECLSILRARIPFKVCRTDISSELVADYMSWCTYISEDRYFVNSTVISEPILADAATEWMSSKSHGQALHILHKYMVMTGNGTVDVGKCGEHVAALILLLARDQALLKKVGEKTLQHQMVTVKEFLKELLSIRVFVYLCTQIPGILDGAISFSHFSNVNQMPTKEHLLQLMARGSAVLCKENQRGIDLLIPVLMPTNKTDYIMHANSVTYISIQIKNYRAKHSKSENIKIAKKMKNSNVELEETHHEYLTIVMNIGEPDPKFEFIDTKSNQKAIILSGIDENLYICLEGKLYAHQLRKENVNELDADLEDEASNITEEVNTNQDNVNEPPDWTIIQKIDIPKYPNSDSYMVRILKTLLGRNDHAASFFKKTSQEYQHMQSICMPFYLSNMNHFEKNVLIQEEPLQKKRKIADT